MKKLLSLLVCFLLSVVIVSAAEETAGIEPDSVWHGLDLALEKIRLVFTFSSAKKAELHMKYAEERLAEAKDMSEKSKNDLVEQTITRYNNEVNDMTNEIEAAKVREEKIDLVVARIDKATSKHVTVLTSLLEKVPETAKKGIQNALDNSQKGREKVLEAVGKKVEKKEEKTEEKKTEKKEETPPKAEEKKEKTTETKEEKKEETPPKAEEKKEETTGTKEEKKPVIDSVKFHYDVKTFSDHAEIFGKVGGKDVKFRIEGDQYRTQVELKLRIVREVVQQYGYNRQDAENSIANIKIESGVKSEIPLVKAKKTTTN